MSLPFPPSACLPIMKHYSLNPALLKDGDKILVHTKGFSPISFAIRLLTESYWNHAGQFVRLGHEELVIEALGTGIVQSPIQKYFNQKKFTIKVVRLKKESFSNLEEYERGVQLSTVKLLNFYNHKKSYDFGAIAFLGFKYLTKGFYKKLRQCMSFLPANPLQSREKFFCSELICTCDRNISSLHSWFYKGKTNSNCSTTTPKDIAKSPHVHTVIGPNRI